MNRRGLWWLRCCNCTVDIMFGRFYEPSCPRHGSLIPHTDLRSVYR